MQSKRTMIGILLAAWFGCAPKASVFSQEGQSQIVEPTVSAVLKLPTKARAGGWLMGKLVLKNIGREPIRLCTFCGRYGGTWTEGQYKVLQEGLDPEFWKSDRPPDEEFDKHIVVVPPGETVALPISFGVVAAGQIKVSAEYTVGKGFAQRHNVWFGAVKAPPITVEVSHGQPGDADKTLDYYQQWLKLHEELLRDNPQSAQLARDVSVSLESLGAFLAARGQTGDVDKALDYYQRSLELRERLLRDNPQSAQAARDVSVSLNNLSALLVARGQPGDAEKALNFFRRSQELREWAAARQSPVRTGRPQGQR